MMRRMDNVLLISAFVAVTLVFGCSSNSDVISENQQQVVVPERIEEGDATWSKMDGIAERGTNRLKAFFHENASVAEHSVIHGDPHVYEAGDNRRRYYWIRPGINGVEWLYVEFSARKVNVEEGHGPPFLLGD